MQQQFDWVTGGGGAIYNRGDIVVDGEATFNGNKAVVSAVMFKEVPVSCLHLKSVLVLLSPGGRWGEHLRENVPRQTPYGALCV